MSSLGTARVRGAIALVAAALTSSAPVARADGGTGFDAFSGSYRYVGGEAEIERLDEAIETVVQKMNFLFRSIARRRIRAPNLPSEQLLLRASEGEIRIERPGRPTVSAPADGTAVRWMAPGGDAFFVRHHVEGGQLHQSFQGRSSLSVNDMELSPDGRRLVVHTSIQATRLPGTLRFSFTYERVP